MIVSSYLNGHNSHNLYCIDYTIASQQQCKSMKLIKRVCNVHIIIKHNKFK